MSIPDAPDKPTILIVDDIPANIDLLKELLRERYKIKAATSGDKALQIAARAPAPDLILLDVMMPGMDGYETCRQLKSNPATAAIPVLFVTGNEEDVEREKVQAVGALDSLAKPIDPERVLTRIATALSR